MTNELLAIVEAIRQNNGMVIGRPETSETGYDSVTVKADAAAVHQLLYKNQPEGESTVVLLYDHAAFSNLYALGINEQGKPYVTDRFVGIFANRYQQPLETAVQYYNAEADNDFQDAHTVLQHFTRL